MIFYSAIIGWLIGAGIEKGNDLDSLNLSQEERTQVAKNQSAFVILNTKYALLLFPSLFVALFTQNLMSTDETLSMFLYCYCSTIALQLLLDFS